MLSDYRFSHAIRVRYSEIDGQKIVFNAHYATYIDVAATEYFRNLFGKGWSEVEEEYGFDLVVRKMTLDYMKPAMFDDLLDIYCRVKKIGNSSISSSFIIAKGEEILLEAEVIQVCYNKEARASQPIPEQVKEMISQFEKLELQQ